MTYPSPLGGRFRQVYGVHVALPADECCLWADTRPDGYPSFLKCRRFSRISFPLIDLTRSFNTRAGGRRRKVLGIRSRSVRCVKHDLALTRPRHPRGSQVADALP